MNYETTEKLFTHMDHLETYSKMWSAEMDKSDPDWKAVTRYGDNIKSARKGIFKVLQDKQDV
tara:strand:- start:350 stop:535 length:186 start_codon:yes stop_codon:yes gene_type:complete